jgi:hypothetical protein
MTNRVVALGQDEYWLSAVSRAMHNWDGETISVKCPGELQRCIPDLPEPDPASVLIVDASGQGKMDEVVAALRSQGWPFVIVVAADPNAKEAISVLRTNLGYDYWEKTYDEADIRNRVKACFNEIAPGKLAKKRKRKPSSQ